MWHLNQILLDVYDVSVASVEIRNATLMACPLKSRVLSLSAHCVAMHKFIMAFGSISLANSHHSDGLSVATECSLHTSPSSVIYQPNAVTSGYALKGSLRRAIYHKSVSDISFPSKVNSLRMVRRQFYMHK